MDDFLEDAKECATRVGYFLSEVTFYLFADPRVRAWMLGLLITVVGVNLAKGILDEAHSVPAKNSIEIEHPK